MTSNDHMIEGSHDIMVGSSSLHVTTQPSSENIGTEVVNMFLISHMI